MLASGSPTRRKLLQNAGLTFEVVKSRIDEDAIRAALNVRDGEMLPGDVAEILARAKAEEVATRSDDDAIVIGADQILSAGDEIFTKANDFEAAREKLLALSGKSHLLHSAVVLCCDDAVVWSHVETSEVVMRAYSAKFVGQYLSAAGQAALDSVGCYQLEGLGAQLIDHVNGDSFTVLGIPMFALLKELRRREVLVS